MLNAKFFEILDENTLHSYQKEGLLCIVGWLPLSEPNDFINLALQINHPWPFSSKPYTQRSISKTNKQTNKKNFSFWETYFNDQISSFIVLFLGPPPNGTRFFFFFFQFKINKKIANHKLDELTFKGEHRQDNYGRTKRGEQKFRGCLVCVFKQPFSVFKQHYTYFHTFFHPQMFSNNNFQFLNTYTKQILNLSKINM